MATEPKWLDGLTQVGDGVWRDEETGMYVHTDLEDGLWDLYVQVGDSQIADDNSVTVSRSSKFQLEVEIRCDQVQLTLDDADRFAAAIKLAARIARAYNETGGK